MLHIKKEGLTFDDVLLIPAHSYILPNNTDLSVKLTNSISLSIPMLSAAMDSVTESRLAISLAQEGGIGFIHKNMSYKKQVREVKKVKRYESGIILDPITVTSRTTIRKVYEMAKCNGFSGYPVMDDNKKVIGIITKRDIRFVNNLDQCVTNVMTPRDQLITIQYEDLHNEKKIISRIMHEKRIEKILIVDKNFYLFGMITIKDLQKSEEKPYACKDEQGRLRVGAAIGINSEEEHINELIKAGIDILLIDSSHGHSNQVLQYIRKVRLNYPNLPIIGGNVVTGEGANALIKAGADIIKVGIGPGSICTTRIVTGVGVPQITAISDVAYALKKKNIPIIADGGIRFSGDIAKAIAAGASCVMVGSIFAGTDESPGEIIIFKGRSYKIHRGMGSLNAMMKGNTADRYFQCNNNKIEKLVPEGVEGLVPYKGSIENIIHQQMGGLRSCMGLTGCANINDLQNKTKFIRISNAGIKESHVHNIIITKESSNYTLN
ncbi:MAG: IMP dehydrogenase [Arsenophonus sp.]|nr:MAG: IMP dehydrogenase [Arsenophonus sp.]